MMLPPSCRPRSLTASLVCARALCAGLGTGAGMSLGTGLRLGLGVGLALSAGCLVPIPLEQQSTSDGGQLLVVTGAMPAFGTQRATTSLDKYNYQVDVLTDSSQVAGRLFIQLSGNCCDLNVDTMGGARFLQNAEAPHPIEPGSQRYTIDFRQPLQPCLQGVSGPVGFIVPVIASGGFIDGPSGVRPEGIGQVDRSHYWTVFCP